MISIVIPVQTIIVITITAMTTITITTIARTMAFLFSS